MGSSADLNIQRRLVIDWYRVYGRNLPWRDPDRTPWGVLVCEVMSQQTPISRVLPIWQEWMRHWPTPAHLAQEDATAVLVAWGRLGYPRRALRLLDCARALVAQHHGTIPSEKKELLALPGIGSYTAAAIRSFAFGLHDVVIDTNIRRIEARAWTGTQFAHSSLTAKERTLAADLTPTSEADSVLWNSAIMELGALVCTSRSPRCEECPLKPTCAWTLAGQPAHSGPPRSQQAWAGTDRQVRGKIMALLREASNHSVPIRAVEIAWPDPEQRLRCTDSLIHDGLAVAKLDHDGAIIALSLPR